MAKRKKIIEEQKPEPVTKRDQSQELVANCDNQQFAVTVSDHKSIDLKSMIRNIRGQQVMLDFELAMLYGVETRRLNEQVKRNINRFPEDFMFQLTKEELESLRSHIVTSNLSNNDGAEILISQNATSKSIERRGGTQKPPYAFTRNGIGMLSSVNEGVT